MPPKKKKAAKDDAEPTAEHMDDVVSEVMAAKKAEAEKIVVDGAAIEARIREDAKRIGESPEKLKASLEKHHGREALMGQLVREKSLDYLTSVANIQTPE